MTEPEETERVRLSDVDLAELEELWRAVLGEPETPPQS